MTRTAGLLRFGGLRWGRRPVPGVTVLPAIRAVERPVSDEAVGGDRLDEQAGVQFCEIASVVA
jgi:hypothetical protein